MKKKPVSVSALKKKITIEILAAFGLPKGDFWQSIAGSWLRKPTTRFSEIFAKLDEDVAEYGLTEAVTRMLPNFVSKTNWIVYKNIVVN